jgi:glycosyltransferase involved in cell wall biosynthesis
MFVTAHCAAVIPCFNEAASIAPLVMRTRDFVPLVLVVDDGSTDGTARLAGAAGAVVISHERNRGKGAALRTGLSWALDQGFGWAVTLDGDGQHSPEDVPKLFDCAEKTNAPLIVGNRMNQAHKMPWLRRQVNRWMSWQLSRRVGIPLPDTQCGLRLLHLETWAGYDPSVPLAQRFEVESEMLMQFAAARQPVEFVPVQVLAGARPSHIRPIRDSIRWLKWWRTCVVPEKTAEPGKHFLPTGAHR